MSRLNTSTNPEHPSALVLISHKVHTVLVEKSRLEKYLKYERNSYTQLTGTHVVKKVKLYIKEQNEEINFFTKATPLTL